VLSSATSSNTMVCRTYSYDDISALADTPAREQVQKQASLGLAAAATAEAGLNPSTRQLQSTQQQQQQQEEEEEQQLGQ